MKNNFIILIIIISITFSFSACNAIKYVPDGKHLLVENSVVVNNKKNIDDEISDYIVQRPNEQVLGIPLQLHIHNLGNKNFNNDFEAWKNEYPKRYNLTSTLFSDKQARGLRNFKYEGNQWFLKSGEEPSILNNKKTKQTIDNLLQHYFNEGFFKTTVQSEETEIKNKKIIVKYNIETGQPYILDSIKINIASKILDSIYSNSKDESLLKKGNQFKVSSFIEEQDRLTSLFRNSGIYRFNKNAINFDADSLNYKTSIELFISDSISDIPLKVQKIKQIKIYPDYSFQAKDEPITDTLNYKGYQFLTKGKLRYNPKYLLNTIFIEPNQVYNDDSRELTRKGLRSLNNFRSVDIRYTELENDDLEAAIYLTPLEKYRIGFNTELTHSNVRQLGTLAKVSFSNRNIFRGAETLKLSVQGSFIDSQDAADNDKLLNAWEVGADISLEIPRFLSPFNYKKFLAKGKSPKTTFTLGSSLQKNIGLDKQRFTGIIDYNWEASKTSKHSFQILNAQFIKNLNPNQYFYVYTYEYGELEAIQESYFPDYELTEDNALDFISDEITSEFGNEHPDDYDTAKNIESRYNIITENAFIPTIAYTYTYTNRKNFKDNNFSFFRARIAAAGNITTAIVNETDENNVKTLFNNPIAQYIRTDLEYKKFWEINIESTLAFRSFLGVAIPYGNSETIPFSRSYFIGGPNDLRAWKVYDLGPGSTQSGLEYNVGNLKFLSSLEYRFEILNSVKGALFIDAGNIWDITSSELNPIEAKFTGFNSLKDIAVGSGFGIRYDLSFILIRVDLGFKTYEPYLESGNKWFQNYNFGHAVYNFGISYPF